MQVQNARELFRASSKGWNQHQRGHGSPPHLPRAPRACSWPTSNPPICIPAGHALSTAKPSFRWKSFDIEHSACEARRSFDGKARDIVMKSLTSCSSYGKHATRCHNRHVSICACARPFESIFLVRVCSCCMYRVWPRGEERLAAEMRTTVYWWWPEK